MQTSAIQRNITKQCSFDWPFGTHISGFAGKFFIAETNSKIKQIMALDPARRPFENNSVSHEDRLYKEDAQVVVAVHTDGGGIGYLGPLGIIDFFPDGGSALQPGCRMSESVKVTVY